MNDERKVPGTLRRVLRTIDFVGKEKEEGEDYKTYEEPVVASLDEANVVTSVADNLFQQDEHVGHLVLHAPVLDFDFPCELIPSTTPGHFHLVMDTQISWAQYQTILTALGAAGILEPGYVDSSLQRGYSAVRLPWIKRPARDETPVTPTPETDSGDFDHPF